MTDAKFSPFHQILLHSNAFKSILEKVNHLTSVQQLVTQSLQGELKKRCRVSSIEHDALILMTTSASFAHQLRFAQTTLLQKLKTHPLCQELKHIRVRVEPPDNLPPSLSLPKLHLSIQNAHHVEAIAQSVPCPKLREALLRLVKHASS